MNIWDRVFGTYQPQRDDIPVTYGITRPMKPGNFLDVYFGEFVALGRDMAKAPGVLNKLLYMVMPPGWSHTGDHKTSSVVRREWQEAQERGLQQPDAQIPEIIQLGSVGGEVGDQAGDLF